jgi:hypothetical protein
MTDFLHPSQPCALTTEGLLEAALDTVKRQLAAKSPANMMYGFDEGGTLTELANLDYEQDEAEYPLVRFEIRHERHQFKTAAGGSLEVPMCFITATDGETFHLASGIVDEDEYHSTGLDDVSSLSEELEEFPTDITGDSLPRRNRLH